MLKINDLVKVYPGPVPALKGVSIDIPQGMFGLLGPNGAGKSTIMKILAGLLEPTSGTVTLDGEDIIARPETLWPKLGYLPQDFGLYPDLSGERMLRFLLDLKGVKAPSGTKRLAAELLERVHLTAAAKRKVKTYSGGMRQRIGIAQAIAGDPRLIVVDEPTAGLDPEERARFHRILGELAEDRIVLLSTHIVEDVDRLCPRFAVIRRGRLVAVTTPSQARGEIDGAIYEGSVPTSLMQDFAEQYRITQEFLVAGVHKVRIYAPQGHQEKVPADFQQVAPKLEDAYLLMMRDDEAARKAVEAA